MATLTVPPSPSLFATNHATTDQHHDDDSIPELCLGSQEPEPEEQGWDADEPSSSLLMTSNNNPPSPRVLVSQLPGQAVEHDGITNNNPRDTATTVACLSVDEEEDPQTRLAVTTNSNSIDHEMDQALLEEEAEDDEESYTLGLFEAPQTTPVLPGGLSNLGNSCYLASVVQMLATLDPLMDELVAFEQQQQQTQQQPKDNTEQDSDKSNTQQQQSSLLQAFVQVLMQLRRGETVRPSDLKQVLDERSPLFVGYQQQDAHEFVTTLLDIMDEDYKAALKKANEENVPTKSEPTTTTTANDDENEAPPSNETATLEEEENGYEFIQLGDAEEEEEEETGGSSPALRKRLKTDSDADAVNQNVADLAPPLSSLRSSANSFSQLGLDEIGLLLHGSPTASPSENTPNPLGTQSEDAPRCKLVGGRMSLNSDRYENIVAQTPSSVSALNHHNREEGEEGEHSNNDGEANNAMSVEPMQSTAAGDGASNEQAPEAPHPAPPKTKSPIESYLTTDVRVRLTCDSCKYTRAHQETFWHLSLELSDDSSVEDGLARFFAPEQRQLKCEKCFGESVTISREIVKLPRALLVHFKRFIVEVSDDYTSVSYRKNTSRVGFDTEMLVREQPDNEDDDDAYLPTSPEPASILSDFLAPDCEIPSKSSDCDCSVYHGQPQECEYRLRSVVNHIGMTASCGHYTADALRQKAGHRGTREWLRLNDSYVSKITEQQATEESAATAYLLLYEVN